MKAPRFDYVRPDTLQATLEILAEHGTDAAILAGGQSLMPMMNLRMARPNVLIDINRIAGLEAIHATPQRLTIGALARHADVLGSHTVRSCAPLLSQAMRHVAHAAIRNRGTIGGSMALADPAAEIPACMVCLAADIVLVSLRGERTVPAAEFFQDLYTTARAPDELIVAAHVRPADPEWRFNFDEIARRHGDFALAGLAFAVKSSAGRIEDLRIAFCGVESAPRRLSRTEACLVGMTPTDASARAVAQTTLSSELEPMASGDYPPAYRRRIAGALLDRALDNLSSERQGEDERA